MELEQLRHDLHKLNERFDNVDEKVEEIYNAITGNQKLGNTGLVKRIEELERLEKRWQQLYWKGLGILTASAVVFELIKIFIDYKIDK